MNLAATEIAPWHHFEVALTRLCESWNHGLFVPLLESDIAGCVYHFLLEELRGDASRLHLDSRLKGAKVNDKFDLVYGPVLSAVQLRDELLRHSDSEAKRKVVNSKGFLAKLRPAAIGWLVLEIKIFATGFTSRSKAFTSTML